MNRWTIFYSKIFPELVSAHLPHSTPILQLWIQDEECRFTPILLCQIWCNCVFFHKGDKSTFVMARGAYLHWKSLQYHLMLPIFVLTFRIRSFSTNSEHTFGRQSNSVVLDTGKQETKVICTMSYQWNSAIFTLKINATWHYCPTEGNPADMITRGTSPSQLASSLLCNKGPPWLTDDIN